MNTATDRLTVDVCGRRRQASVYKEG